MQCRQRSTSFLINLSDPAEVCELWRITPDQVKSSARYVRCDSELIHDVMGLQYFPNDSFVVAVFP